jgi:HSP20 family molecular chaperone IbpA
MTESAQRELQAKEKQEAAPAAEHTKMGPTFTPAVDIFETDTDIVLLADMPGVTSEDLDIDLRENILTLEGGVIAPEESGESDVLREYVTGKYYRQFTLSEAIDQAKIEAFLKDGVLRLTLPKVAKATPRKITVSTS